MIFLQFPGYFWIYYHIWNYTWDPESVLSLPTVSTTSQFLIFCCYFWFRIAVITIFGNVPWTLKMFSNIITNLSTIHQFSLIFCYFLAILQLKKGTFPYLEMCPGPWKCFPTLSPTVRNTPSSSHKQQAFYWVRCPIFSYILITSNTWYCTTLIDSAWGVTCDQWIKFWQHPMLVWPGTQSKIWLTMGDWRGSK